MRLRARCAIVNTVPATVKWPSRATPVFAATLNAALPAPNRELPPETVSQDESLTAVQPHCVPDAETATAPSRPL